MPVLLPRILVHVALALVIWKQASVQMALALRAVDCVILGLRLSHLSIPEFYHSKPHIGVWVLMGSHSGDEASCGSEYVTIPRYGAVVALPQCQSLNSATLR